MKCLGLNNSLFSTQSKLNNRVKKFMPYQASNPLILIKKTMAAVSKAVSVQNHVEDHINMLLHVHAHHRNMLLCLNIMTMDCVAWYISIDLNHIISSLIRRKWCILCICMESFDTVAMVFLIRISVV